MFPPLRLIRSQLPIVRADCRQVLEQIADRAEGYLNDPTNEERFHAMDPKNIGEAFGIMLA